ncbi:hypothetical protein NL676_008298 [Syzygium grande]|nr:hypothetical protein NL676_008298 [Syzygium grande]
MNENYRSLDREHGEDMDANRRLTFKIEDSQIQGGSKDQTPDGSFVSPIRREEPSRASVGTRTDDRWMDLQNEWPWTRLNKAEANGVT